MQQSALGIQRREKGQPWALERASRQRRFSNWALDGLTYFKWGGNTLENIGNEHKAEAQEMQQCLERNGI